ncbi:unnamed protein product [Orchesella dallaii]|uniref:C2H2-type domain-containing protein n=1 Tax=Orchesella dallaii TaxID=48710 RepID=A0ABP1RQT3_9HEXA
MHPTRNNVFLSRTRSGSSLVRSQQNDGRSPIGCPTVPTEACNLRKRNFHQLRKSLNTSSNNAGKIVKSQTKAEVKGLNSRRNGKAGAFNCEKIDKLFRTVRVSLPNSPKSSIRRKGESKRNDVFKCPRCKKGIIGLHNLKRHMLIHSRTRPTFKCQECGKELLSKESLNRHQRLIHEGERAFSCGLCAAALKTKENLIRHIQMTHSTSKEIARDMANEVGVAAEARPVPVPKRKISRATLLVRRSCARARHDPVSAYKCPECKMFFKSKHLQIRHLAIHKDVRPFGCQFCLWIFKRKDNLMVHLHRMHGKTEKAARKMVYGCSGPCRNIYNVRRCVQSSSTKPTSSGVGKSRKPAKNGKTKIIARAPLPNPKLKASDRDVIVIVGNLKFCTPRIRLQPCDADPRDCLPEQGCQTYDQWFWQDYCRAIDEQNLASLVQTEPEYEYTLVEMAELLL